MEQSSSEAKFSVLIVDDNDSNRKVLTILLSRRGYRCESAVNGREAMRKFAQARFDAVITDVQMPEMDGITLTRELTLRFPDLPVMVMTGQPDEEFRESAFSAGAREVLGKPFDIWELTVRLQKIFDIQNLNREQRV